jgi:ribosomal-protein-alanine acetyltransferase
MSSLTFATAVVKLMQERDIDAVLDIERRSNPHPWTREHFENALRLGYLCFVTSENDRIVGFAIARVLVDDAELLLIAVAPEQRRGGCATLLLNTLIERMREIDKSPLHLEVRASNESAIAFYEARQFVRSGLRKGYYPNGVPGNLREDAVLMQRAV